MPYCCLFTLFVIVGAVGKLQDVWLVSEYYERIYGIPEPGRTA